MDMVSANSGESAIMADTNENYQLPSSAVEMEQSAKSEADAMEVSENQMNEEARGPSLQNPNGNQDSAGTTDTPTVKVLVPSMRGVLSYAGGSISCKGKWAMSDVGHSIPGQTSDFEFKLVTPDEDNTEIFPVNGKYTGWFMLKQALPLKGSIRVEDKEIHIKFEKMANEDNKYNVSGNGVNKFGKFNVYGTLTEQGQLHVYREYYQFATMNSPQNNANNTIKKETIKRSSIQNPSNIPTTTDIVTPRESSGRIRKMSSLLQDFEESKPNKTTLQRENSTNFSQQNSSISNAPILSRQTSFSTSERTHRISPIWKKLSELLKEMMKLPNAMKWFNEPVDPIRLNIPDYFTIIKHPMDFSTIRTRIESNYYENNVELFYNDVNLIFNNAILFNNNSDNLVNIAAKELQMKFEEKFRNILSNNNDFVSYSLLDNLSNTKNESKPKINSNNFAKKETNFSKNTPRARPYIPPAIMDNQQNVILELQNSITNLKNELNEIKKILIENNLFSSNNFTKTTNNLKSTKSSFQQNDILIDNNLTREEKLEIVNNVSKLSNDKMNDLIEIIKNGLPNSEKNRDLNEVPLDLLDNVTLRKLQKFLRDNIYNSSNNNVKKRNLERQKSEPIFNHSKKSKLNDNLYDQTVTALDTNNNNSNEIDLFETHELFNEENVESNLYDSQANPSDNNNHNANTTNYEHLANEFLPEAFQPETFQDLHNTKQVHTLSEKEAANVLLHGLSEEEEGNQHLQDDQHGNNGMVLENETDGWSDLASNSEA